MHQQFVYSWDSRALDKNRDGNFFISTVGVNYNLCNANRYIRKFFCDGKKKMWEARMIETFAVLGKPSKDVEENAHLWIWPDVYLGYFQDDFSLRHTSLNLWKMNKIIFFQWKQKNVSLLSFVIHRLEMCHDRHDQRSWKNISNCVIFSWKQRIFLQNLRINMKFTHLFSKFTHPILQSYWNFTFSFQSIIDIEIYAVLLLAKLVPIYAILVCKIFGTKIRSCKIFD